MRNLITVENLFTYGLLNYLWGQTEERSHNIFAALNVIVSTVDAWRGAWRGNWTMDISISTQWNKKPRTCYTFEIML